MAREPIARRSRPVRSPVWRPAPETEHSERARPAAPDFGLCARPLPRDGRPLVPPDRAGHALPGSPRYTPPPRRALAGLSGRATIRPRARPAPAQRAVSAAGVRRQSDPTPRLPPTGPAAPRRPQPGHRVFRFPYRHRPHGRRTPGAVPPGARGSGAGGPEPDVPRRHRVRRGAAGRCPVPDRLERAAALHPGRRAGRRGGGLPCRRPRHAGGAPRGHRADAHAPVRPRAADYRRTAPRPGADRPRARDNSAPATPAKPAAPRP